MTFSLTWFLVHLVLTHKIKSAVFSLCCNSLGCSSVVTWWHLFVSSGTLEADGEAPNAVPVVWRLGPPPAPPSQSQWYLPPTAHWEFVGREKLLSVRIQARHWLLCLSLTSQLILCAGPRLPDSKQSGVSGITPYMMDTHELNRVLFPSFPYP